MKSRATISVVIEADCLDLVRQVGVSGCGPPRGRILILVSSIISTIISTSTPSVSSVRTRVTALTTITTVATDSIDGVWDSWQSFVGVVGGFGGGDRRHGHGRCGCY